MIYYLYHLMRMSERGNNNQVGTESALKLSNRYVKTNSVL